MSTTASRLLTLILLLQNRPNRKAAELAGELGVSVRTLHRYLAELDEMGIPVYAERGPYGGFSLVRGYKLPPLVFSPEEAAALSLGTGLVEQLWGELYREPARAAQAKLENVLPEDQRREVAWARRTLVNAGQPRREAAWLSPTLESLRQAAHDRLRVELRYQGRGKSQAETRQVDPYALAHRWGWWYLVGYCHSRAAVRTFRLDRIAGLSILDQSFDMPEDFEARAFLDQAEAAGALLSVRVRFSPEMAAVARESSLNWESLEANPDGSVEVVFRSPDPLWATSLIVSFGPGVRVLEPAEVREAVREWAQAIAAGYQ